MRKLDVGLSPADVAPFCSWRRALVKASILDHVFLSFFALLVCSLAHAMVRGLGVPDRSMISPLWMKVSSDAVRVALGCLLMSSRDVGYNMGQRATALARRLRGAECVCGVSGKYGSAMMN